MTRAPSIHTARAMNAMSAAWCQTLRSDDRTAAAMTTTQSAARLSLEVSPGARLLIRASSRVGGAGSTRFAGASASMWLTEWALSWPTGAGAAPSVGTTSRRAEGLAVSARAASSGSRRLAERDTAGRDGRLSSWDTMRADEGDFSQEELAFIGMLKKTWLTPSRVFPGRLGGRFEGKQVRVKGAGVRGYETVKR